MSGSLLRRWMERYAPGFEDPLKLEARAKIGSLEGWVSIVSNTILAGVKAWLALLSGSLALLADSFHTFTDSFTSLMVLIGFYIARKPADPQHPFGHGRMESVASLIIGVMLGVASIELGRAAIDRLCNPSSIEAPVWIILVVAATAVFKEILARFSLALGHLIRSDMLKADGWHHRSDVFSTILVVVAFLGVKVDLLWIDGLAGLGVAAFVAWAAWLIIKNAVSPLIGEQVPEDIIRRVTEEAKSVEDVLGVHEIVMQVYGLRGVISLHIEMYRDKTLVQAHEICQEVEKRISEVVNAHVTVHVDPQGAFHENTEEIRKLVSHEVEKIDNCTGFHDLRIERLYGGEICVRLDITSKREPTDQEREECQRRLQGRIRAYFPRAKVVVEMDPPFCAADPEIS